MSSRSAEFICQVKQALAEKLSSGVLSVVDEASSDSFGNAWIEFKGSGYAIRFVRDRGQIYFEARNSDSNQWWPVDFICELTKYPNPSFDLSSNLESFFQLFPELESLFNDKGYPSASERLEKIADDRRHINPRSNK